MRQHADAAAEIGAPARETRQVFHQQRAAGIEPIPAEHAGLGPKAEARLEPRRAGGNGLVDALERVRPQADADAVMRFRAVADGAAEPFELAREAGATGTLGGEDRKRRAGCQRP